MKYYKYLMVLLILVIMVGCGQNQKTDSNITTEAAMSDEDQIRAILTEYIDRVKEGDKTVLYENEFKYYTDSVTLSMYMELPRVLDYKYDSLYNMIIDSINIMDDSAALRVRVQYLSASGGIVDKPYPMKVYKRYDEKWVRPYQSSYAIEKEFIERYKEYLKAIGEDEGK
ncbi:MAG: hypothetical protein ABIJ45_07745 [Candidatus Zixiibacteriota bacterium]